MLGLIAAVLIVLWLLGFLTFHVSTGLIRVLLVIRYSDAPPALLQRSSYSLIDWSMPRRIPCLQRIAFAWRNMAVVKSSLLCQHERFSRHGKTKHNASVSRIEQALGLKPK